MVCTTRQSEAKADIVATIMRAPTHPLTSVMNDKSRAFWLLQSGGWLAYALLRLLSGPAFSVGNKSFMVVTLIATATGFCLTLILASLFRRIIDRGGASQWAIAGSLVVLAASIFATLEIWGLVTFIDRGWRPSMWDYTTIAFFDLFVLTSWSGLYFGINYYLMAEDQHKRLLAMTAQAHAAQLKMLRYQINPHFLFNTLNSISTLVLAKETDRANAMLERLAAFLRATLAGEPTNTVPLAQELKTLELYLDIERLRFEQRLRVVFDIEPECQRLELPALLLQPLVENAIKYAVASQEEGATITISAHNVQQGVELVIADTGPGFTPGKRLLDGVGLANTRERLQQMFGAEGSFAIIPNMPKGTRVVLTIPQADMDGSMILSPIAPPLPLYFKEAAE